MYHDFTKDEIKPGDELIYTQGWERASLVKVARVTATQIVIEASNGAGTYEERYQRKTGQKVGAASTSRSTPFSARSEILPLDDKQGQALLQKTAFKNAVRTVKKRTEDFEKEPTTATLLMLKKAVERAELIAFPKS